MTAFVFRISGRRKEPELVTNAAAIPTNPMLNIAAAAPQSEKAIFPHVARERFAAQHGVRLHVRR